MCALALAADPGIMGRSYSRSVHMLSDLAATCLTFFASFQREQQIRNLRDQEQLTREKTEDLKNRATTLQKQQDSDRQRFQEQTEETRVRHQRELDSVRKEANDRVEAENKSLKSSNDENSKLQTKISDHESKFKTTVAQHEAEREKHKAEICVHKADIKRAARVLNMCGCARATCALLPTGRVGAGGRLGPLPISLLDIVFLCALSSAS